MILHNVRLLSAADNSDAGAGSFAGSAAASVIEGSGAVVAGAVVSGSVLSAVSGSVLSVFSGAVLSGAVVSGSVLSVFSGAVLSGAVVSGAVLSGPVLSGVSDSAIFSTFRTLLPATAAADVIVSESVTGLEGIP